MGYDVSINRCELFQKELTAEEKIYQKLKHGDLDLDPNDWTTKENRIEPVEWYFKWGDWFVEDLTKMAKAGVTGFVETIGEEGEYTKYMLKDGKVEEYYGEVVYPEKPNDVYE